VAVQELTDTAVGPNHRRQLVILTIMSAVLVLPAMVLAAFSAFFFDDPNAGWLAWVLATPFLTLPLTLIGAVFTSWLLHARGHSHAAVRVAALPSLQLVLAFGTFFVAAALDGWL
jgi:hypothetical protein